ncbi:regulator of G-protein signaling 7 [Hydra vulgaris]|nr:regulator of G-protein signaling 7-like [Hydra vulgaris]
MSTKLDSQLSASLQRLEAIVKLLSDKNNGVNITTVKTMWETIPEVCTGSDIVTWIQKHLKLESRAEALGVGKGLAKYGYIFQVIDSKLTLKDDSAYYRFQSSYYWPTKEVTITNKNYAIHLCKRLFSNKNRSNLDTSEMDQLSRLQNAMGHIWESIWIDAEAAYKVDKKKQKPEKLIIESQERAFWNLHKPSSDSDYVLSVDPLKFKKKQEKRKLHTDVVSSSPMVRRSSLGSMKSYDSLLYLPKSESLTAIDSLIFYCNQYQIFDPFMRPTDSASTFHSDDQIQQDNFKKVGTSVERWSLSLDELLRDPQGVKVFLKHLEKEHSSENLRFWLACEEFRSCPLKKLKEKAEAIYNEFLSRKAIYQVNLDSKLMQTVREGTSNLNHFIFFPAQQEIFRLMKSDSYPRFLKSESYNLLRQESISPAQRGQRRGLLSMLTSPQHKV